MKHEAGKRAAKAPRSNKDERTPAAQAAEAQALVAQRPLKYSEKQKAIIRHTVDTCPVSQSLNISLKQTFILNFSD